jgi:hypothetical protein
MDKWPISGDVRTHWRVPISGNHDSPGSVCQFCYGGANPAGFETLLQDIRWKGKMIYFGKRPCERMFE